MERKKIVKVSDTERIIEIEKHDPHQGLYFVGRVPKISLDGMSMETGICLGIVEDRFDEGSYTLIKILKSMNGAFSVDEKRMVATLYAAGWSMFEELELAEKCYEYERSIRTSTTTPKAWS